MAPAGFYGKVPSHGDFVQRSLRPSFIKLWDRWLQAGIAESRDVLGEAWLDLYLTSPVWRFALHQEVTGDTGAAGVFFPSVDRVGRYFPFTLARSVDMPMSPIDFRTDDKAWYDRVEALALGVLADDFSLDQLIDDLNRLTMGESIAKELPQQQAWHFCGHDEALLAQHIGRYCPPPCGLFWTNGSDIVAPSILFVQSMPTARQFAAFLDGDWATHGWNEAPS